MKKNPNFVDVELIKIGHTRKNLQTKPLLYQEEMGFAASHNKFENRALKSSLPCVVCGGGLNAFSI